MKRFISAALAMVFVAVLAGSAFASNAVWRTGAVGTVKWRHAGAGALGFSQPAAGFSDTTYVSAAPARADTTTEWSMEDVMPVGVDEFGSAAADSLTPAYFIIQADSSVASSVNFKNTTVTFQVNYGLSTTGWQTVYSALSPLATDGVKTLIVPIFQRLAAITTDVGIDFKHPGDIFAPRVRAIVTWGTSAAVPSATVRIKKHKNPAGDR